MSHSTTNNLERRGDGTDSSSTNATGYDRSSPPSRSIFDSPLNSFTAYAEQTAPRPANRRKRRQERGTATLPTSLEGTVNEMATSPSNSSLNPFPESFYGDHSCSSQLRESVASPLQAHPPNNPEEVNRVTSLTISNPPSSSSVDESPDIAQAAHAALERMFGRRLEQNRAMRVSFRGPSES